MAERCRTCAFYPKSPYATDDCEFPLPLPVWFTRWVRLHASTDMSPDDGKGCPCWQARTEGKEADEVSER